METKMQIKYTMMKIYKSGSKFNDREMVESYLTHEECHDEKRFPYGLQTDDDGFDFIYFHVTMLP